MKKFNLYKYMLGDYSFLSIDILTSTFGISKRYAQNIITQLHKEGVITKVRKGMYITKLAMDKMHRFSLVMLLDPSCYISLYSILDQRVVKQGYVKTYGITNKRITKTSPIYKEKKIDIIYSSIPMTFGIYRKGNVRVADMERALLDLIYLHVYTGFPIMSELYLQNTINKETIKNYLQHYPKRVENFYYNKLYEYEK